MAGPGQEKEGEESSGRPFGGRCSVRARRRVGQSRVEGRGAEGQMVQQRQDLDAE